MTITLELTPELFQNLRVMVTAGGKNAETGENGIMAAAQLLQLLAQAAEKAQAPKANGHAEAEAHVSH